MKNDSILCHLGAPRTAKPATLQEYGKLREQMIQKPWVALSEVDFVRAVTEQGCPFYQSLMNGRDLMEFLALPIPRDVWNRTRPHRDPPFVQFVEECLARGGSQVGFLRSMASRLFTR